MTRSSVSFRSLEGVELPAQPVFLALGMFDGVHLGHRSVISECLEAARRRQGLAGVLTFWPHPSRLFRPENPTPQIMDPETKERFLFGMGIDFLIEQPFTREFASIAAENFLPYLRQCLPELSGIYVGENWRFGRGRRGDVALLVNSGRALGVEVAGVPGYVCDGAAVSSTRIRQLLASGEVAAAARLLGQPYFTEGIVQAGRGLGKTLGVPTLNIAWKPELRPRYGVYVVRVGGEEGRPSRPGVANFGVRPTVEAAASDPVLEVHVIGDCPFSHGDFVRVEWLTLLRPEKKFASLEELRAQIGRDKAAAADYLAQAAE